MPKYNDKELNQWMNAGAPFTLTNKQDLPQLLEQVEHKYQAEALSLIITLWASGARPNEVLNLKREDVKKNPTNITIIFPASKGSKARALDFPLTQPYAKQVWLHIQKLWDGQYLFPHFRTETPRKASLRTKWVLNKETKLKEKVTYRLDKDYPDIAHKLGYWFKKWGLRVPYYYRHNRMTIAGEDLPIRQLQELKGAKKEESVYCYLRSTKKAREKIGRSLFK